MTTARPHSVPLEADGWGASTPDTSVDRWRSEVSDGIATSGARPGVGPVVTVTATVRDPGRRATSMLNDYYSRIWVIPEIIDLRNPKLGQGQPYKIWNAYLQSNTLSSIVEVDATGLVDSAVPPVVFKATQILDFSITVGPTAPITVDASFTFNFTEGFGTLIFRAERAVLLGQRPEIPFVQELSYDTNILQAYDGTEQRISVRPAPRQTLRGKLIFENDAQARDLRAQLFVGVVSPVVVPLWHEPFLTTADAASGTDTISGDFAIADWLVDDFLYIETRDGTIKELVQLSAVTDPLITIRNVLTSSYPAGSLVYPTATCFLNDGSGFSRRPINVSEMDMTARSFDRKVLGGKTASIPTHNSLALLDVRPLNNSPVAEAFTLNAERADYGGFVQIDFSQEFAKVARVLEFIIPSREDLQFWKLFLDGLSGRREPFYTPTFRDDLIVDTQPDIGGSSIILTDSPNYVTDWWISLGHRDIVLTNQDGDRLYRTIIGAVDNGDGTVTITLGTALPGTVGGSTITSIEFLELVRLASDAVSFSHFGDHSMISLSVTTTKE